MNTSKTYYFNLTYITLLLVTLFSCHPQQHNHYDAEQERMDTYLNLSQEERLQPEHATASFAVHEGLEVALFAAEPMVVNPTNFDVDEKGRVWVCESYNYAVPEEEQTEAGGRITILEDTDQDGKVDKRTVYYQGEDVNIALGIAVLGNKVYVTRSPDVLIFTDENGDDQPDKKEKLFTGMGEPGDHSAHAIVFGPDGKFYFNMGNYAGPVKDNDGNIIVDQAGNEVVQYEENYIGGMIFRCNPDGSAFEVLGHNFRNNYEVAVDSYGNLWQSDNDDDGNKSCRINFILEYGNYGYLDEMTQQSWQTQRTNIEEETVRRHWHQNDPGVVPNLLITGAGSPAGIAVYEGELLPEVFQGQIIHTDAGPNVARAYPVEKKGAGYTAAIVNIVKSQYDQWFRPVDICTAPDGSVFMADWYDPGVGGGAAADAQKGRIFRVAPEASQYRFSVPAISSPATAIEALKSPNQATRYLGWIYLHEMGDQAEPELLKLYNDSNPVYKARALWLLGKIPGKAQEYIQQAFKDKNPDIRIVGIRLARQSDVVFEAIVQSIANDPSPEVRREIAIGLHLRTSQEAADLWADLALQYDGEDRWYLEALGIGAANHWDACLAAWQQKAGAQWNTQQRRNIIWRARSAQAIPLLAALIKDAETSPGERLKYFRAFDFHTDESKQDVLLSLLEGDHPSQEQITALALQHIDPEKVGRPPVLKQALDHTLQSVQGTQEFINLVSRYQLTDKKEALLELAVFHADNEMGVDAARLLLNPETFNGLGLIEERFNQSEEDAIALIEAMQHLGNKASLNFLSSVVLNEQYGLQVRKAAILGMGKSWPGETALLECVKDPEFDPELKSTAGSVLFNVYRIEIQEKAEQYIERPETSGGKTLPTIRNLVASVGNTTKGKAVFAQYCQTCHVINGEGNNFGPQLSEIGDKLSKEGLYRAIMFPSEGINYDYEGYLLRMKDGSTAMGILESETKEDITLRMMGGIRNQYKVEDIVTKEANAQSLMPNLSTVMSEEELIDLVEYLAALKKETI